MNETRLVIYEYKSVHIMHLLNENWPSCWIFASPNLYFRSISKWFSMSIPVWAIENTWKTKKDYLQIFMLLVRIGKEPFPFKMMMRLVCPSMCTSIYMLMCSYFPVVICVADVVFYFSCRSQIVFTFSSIFYSK